MYILEKLLTIIFTIVFSLILIIAVGTLLTWSIYMIGVLPFIALMVFFYLKKRKRFLAERTCKYIWYFISVCSLFLLIYLSFSCEVEYSWDWGKILVSASNYVQNGEIESQEYFARYPNNQFCLLCITGLFQIIKFIYPDVDFQILKNVSIVVSCLFVWGTMIMIYNIGKEVWGTRRAVLAGIFSAGCLPFYMYAQFLYTDTPGMLFLTFILYIGIRIVKEKIMARKLLFAIFLGIAAGITYHIKVIPFIVYIAIISAEIIQEQRMKEKLAVFGVALLCCAATWYFTGKISDNIASEKFGITAEEKEHWKYPLTHWVMMGLNKESNGGYHEDDVNYTASFHTLTERKKENIAVIIKRMQDFGITGYLTHVLWGKLPRTWGNSCLAGDDYIGRMPKNINSIFVQILSWNGKYHDYCLIYTWTYYAVLFLGTVLSGLYSVKSKNTNDILLMGRIALLGLVFFQILWECNSRYLITFIPLMIIMALDGYFRIKKVRGVF